MAKIKKLHSSKCWQSTGTIRVPYTGESGDWYNPLKIWDWKIKIFTTYRIGQYKGWILFIEKKINQETKGNPSRIYIPAKDSTCIANEYYDPVNVDGREKPQVTPDDRCLL